MSSMRKLTRAQMRPWAIAHLKTKQGGLCPLCGEPISLQARGNQTDYVVDHDHDSGEIRGVLHRSCNAAEGKVANAAGRWGAKSMKYQDILPWLEKLLVYLKQPGTGLVYPLHKTEEERNAAALLKRRKADAARRARAKLKGTE